MEKKLMQLITDVESLEDFIKICASDFKINKETANELLRITRQSIERALK